MAETNLRGKTVLVTGGSRGLGAASARRLATAGADVAIAYEKSGDKAGAFVEDLEHLRPCTPLPPRYAARSGPRTRIRRHPLRPTTHRSSAVDGSETAEGLARRTGRYRAWSPLRPDVERFRQGTQDKRPRPVMVWLHGGDSSRAGADYEPSRMAGQGDVDVVTVNYRLGTFGYFSNPQLGREGSDFGLQGQLAPLRWVRANARAFGGDPGNVTVFGESSGAFDAGAQRRPVSAVRRRPTS